MDARVQTIYGGTNEIMKELIAERSSNMTSRHLPTSGIPITANLVLNLLKIKYNTEREEH